MSKKNDPMQQILKQIESAARGRVSHEVAKINPLPKLNPAQDKGKAARQPQPADDGEALPALYFQTPDADLNLACAVGAYRAAGDAGCLVGQHKSGQGFFGDEDQLLEHCKRQDQAEEDWDVWDNPDEILDMEYDRQGIQTMLRMIDSQEDTWDKAKAAHEQFHWGDKDNAAGLVTIPGVAGPAFFLGVARRIEYGAKKGGKWQEYYHEHGEESGTFPAIYGIGEPDAKGQFRAYVVYGGNMHITERGIID
jgi:hypothetical protein